MITIKEDRLAAYLALAAWIQSSRRRALDESLICQSRGPNEKFRLQGAIRTPILVMIIQSKKPQVLSIMLLGMAAPIPIVPAVPVIFPFRRGRNALAAWIQSSRRAALEDGSLICRSRGPSEKILLRGVTRTPRIVMIQQSEKQVVILTATVGMAAPIRIVPVPSVICPCRGRYANCRKTQHLCCMLVRFQNN
jgi:hypothetical protein